MKPIHRAPIFSFENRRMPGATPDSLGANSMIDGTPLVRPADRFPLGLAGRTVPISAELPTATRPWGMDCAVIPVPIEFQQLGKHEKPTKTCTRSVPTTFTNDSKPQTDQRTETVTD